MATTITRFQLPPGIPTEAVKNGFLEVAPKFKHPAGLLRKYFLISEDEKTGGGVYLWNSMEEARAFSEGVLRKMIKTSFKWSPPLSITRLPWLWTT
jgi:putative monooxygenase ydhR